MQVRNESGGTAAADRLQVDPRGEPRRGVQTARDESPFRQGVGHAAATREVAAA